MTTSSIQKAGSFQVSSAGSYTRPNGSAEVIWATTDPSFDSRTGSSWADSSAGVYQF